MMHIESSDHGLVEVHSPEFKEIIELYNQSLAENRDTNGLLMRDVEGLANAAARAVQAFEKIRAGWRALTGWDRVEKLLLVMEEAKILQVAPTAVTIFSRVPDYNREGTSRMRTVPCFS